MVWIFARTRECGEMVFWVVISVWVQVPSLCVTSNDVRNRLGLLTLGPRLSASENKAREINRMSLWCWPGERGGVRCLQRQPSVTVRLSWQRGGVTMRLGQTRDTRLSAASFLSSQISVTNLVKKAEAVRGRGAEQSVGIVTIYQHHSCQLAPTDPSQSLSNISI